MPLPGNGTRAGSVPLENDAAAESQTRAGEGSTNALPSKPCAENCHHTSRMSANG